VGLDMSKMKTQGVVKREEWVVKSVCAEPIKKEILDNSELLQSFTEEGKVSIESFENEESDVIFSLKIENTNLIKKLEIMEGKVKTLEKELEGSLDELESDKGLKQMAFSKSKYKLQKEIVSKDETISNLSTENKSLQQKVDEIEIEKVEDECRILELENMLRDYTEQEEYAGQPEDDPTEDKKIPETTEKEVQTDIVKTITEGNQTEIVETITEGNQTEIVDTLTQGVQTKNVEMTTEGVQTDNMETKADIKKEKETNSGANQAVLTKKLDDAYKILVEQELNVLAKNKEIERMREKIRAWGLEDKLGEERTLRRRTITGAKGDIKSKDAESNAVGLKRKAQSIVKEEAKFPKNPKKEEAKFPKTPKKDIKVENRLKTKTPKKEVKVENKLKAKTPQSLAKKFKSVKINNTLDTSTVDDEEDDEVSDYDPNHPTSSFNLRMKGRINKNKKEKLKPIGPLVDYFMETVPDVIVNRGENPETIGVNRYFAIRNRGKKSESRKSEAFKNPGPRMSSWKEYRSKYQKSCSEV